MVSICQALWHQLWNFRVFFICKRGNLPGGLVNWLGPWIRWSPRMLMRYLKVWRYVNGQCFKSVPNFCWFQTDPNELVSTYEPLLQFELRVEIPKTSGPLTFFAILVSSSLLAARPHIRSLLRVPPWTVCGCCWLQPRRWTWTRPSRPSCTRRSGQWSQVLSNKTMVFHSRLLKKVGAYKKSTAGCLLKKSCDSRRPNSSVEQIQPFFCPSGSRHHRADQ